LTSASVHNAKQRQIKALDLVVCCMWWVAWWCSG